MSLAMTIPPKLPEVPPLDGETQQRALERQRQLLKPSGSLGKLEILSTQIAGMTGRLDWLPRTPVVVVCAGDHGIAEQGVSAYPRNVTKQMVLNFLEGRAAINVLARQFGAEVMVVDAGVAGILPQHDRLIDGKINYGTADFSAGMAMSPGQTDKAIQLGLQVADHMINNGADVIITGEMGIGNTTAAAALIAALTSADPERVTGRGTGINQAQLERKVRLIRTALDLHAPVQVDTLAKFGGYEIATLVGLMVGAAARRVPVVLDGVITASAALVAAKLAPRALNYFIAGHRGVEPGHAYALQALGLTPVLELSLRLGEGTGGALALPIIEAAMRTLQEMATFGEAGVSGPSD
jgi:nicotinate-nucleotide--dimethylbenzimidazole phosphoribosyltransferase